jgi:hypothetical protein
MSFRNLIILETIESFLALTFTQGTVLKCHLVRPPQPGQEYTSTMEKCKVNLISYRGHWEEKDPWQTQGGLATEPVLRALNIPIWHTNNVEDIQRRIKDAYTLAPASLHPATILLHREVMWEE